MIVELLPIASCMASYTIHRCIVPLIASKNNSPQQAAACKDFFFPYLKALSATNSIGPNPIDNIAATTIIGNLVPPKKNHNIHIVNVTNVCTIAINHHLCVYILINHEFLFSFSIPYSTSFETVCALVISGPNPSSIRRFQYRQFSATLAALLYFSISSSVA